LKVSVYIKTVEEIKMKPDPCRPRLRTSRFRCDSEIGIFDGIEGEI
jgi:hypothetical protein